MSYSNENPKISKQNADEKNVKKASSLRPSSFTPAPRVTKPKKLKQLGILVSTLIVAASIFTYNFSKSSSNSPLPVIAMEKQEKVLLFSEDDHAHQLNNLVQEDFNSPQIQAITKEYDPRLIEQIKSGDLKFFAVRLIDNVAEDGDIVEIALDGKKVGQIRLSHLGATIHIPLNQNAQHTLEILAILDGGGGVTLGASTSTGSVYSKVLQVGESDIWHLKGSK
jgi:hypothetical protein